MAATVPFWYTRNIDGSTYEILTIGLIGGVRAFAVLPRLSTGV